MMAKHDWMEFHTCDLGEFSISALASSEFDNFYKVAICFPGEEPFPFDYPDSRRDAIALCEMAKLVAGRLEGVAHG